MWPPPLARAKHRDDGGDVCFETLAMRFSCRRIGKQTLDGVRWWYFAVFRSSREREKIVPLGFVKPQPSRVTGAIVTFEPCAPSAWHTHPLGQTLIVTSGCGRVQRLGGTIEEIRVR